ncbi:hypothetical protein [Flammeovirga kamogawensis]|uniref:DUF58 domain-containing protein n=1 Tax=Flammeovirga kamogawensis TaxID=373891 RepID=A0ABX8GSJ9_9BACT|nr:hypothetical protein [Flammeovirga kamogawensis]MBB6462966.1 hypothetical protein [Flammeovirga kamogawensis]QWG06491.1 hypothetical protein KM029_14285 [Flammeovirga kamogawensis]TRX68319.1 hypothetical protein EO216_09300 [Flammeovirga kamogawensis]
MNIRETRRGGTILNVQAFLAPSICQDFKRKLYFIHLGIWAVLLLFSLVYLVIPAVSIILIGIIAFDFFKIYKLGDKEVSIQFYILGETLMVRNHDANPDITYVEDFKVDDIEQFFIKKTGEDKYGFFAIVGRRQRVSKQILEFSSERLHEIHDLKVIIHEKLDVDVHELEGEYEGYSKKEIAEPKRNRQYFKLFNQDIKDIRQRGVITLQGDDYQIHSISQIDWENGFSSLKFALDEESSLFYYSSVSKMYLIKEQNIHYLFDLNMYHLADDLSNIENKLEVDGVEYYLCAINQGKYFSESALEDEGVYQLLFENDEQEKFLRFIIINNTIKVYKGERILLHQLQSILPQVSF